MKRIMLVVFMIAVTAAVYSQSKLYVPRNIVKAYEKGTRSYDGKPGLNYWTNHADYKIQAEVFPKERIVKGTEQIKYYNESPDTLRRIVLRLYQDIMKKGNQRDERISPADLTDGVTIDTLIINGVGIKTKGSREVNRTATNLIIGNLPNIILPKTSVAIEAKWSVIIPKESRIRMGAYSDSTLYVAYWYPQVSVYDDIDGWDTQEYGGAVEFYNDKNNFDYEITVPNKFLVWGTGVYQNLQDVVKPDIYSRYKEAQESDGVLRIVREEDLINGATVNKEKNIWKIKAEGVPDVSFAVSSGYVWDGISAEVDANGRRVFTDAVFPIKSKGWEEVAPYAKQSVENLSKVWPGVPFPYPKITTFNGETMGGGGMEIPMMTNNGMGYTPASQAGVTFHEIAHTYFPFYMGINERKYAWMDEGWATFFTSALLPNIVSKANEFSGNVLNVGRYMGKEFDTPMVLPSIATRGQLLSFNSYTKASISYFVLQDILGDELFKKALHEYINRWNGKHPIPWDYFFTFNDVAKEDLSWFWKPWYFEQGFPDLAIKSAKIKGNDIDVVVEKIGTVPVPANLIVTYPDGSTEVFKKSASVWRSGNKEVKINFKVKKAIKKIEIDEWTVPDADEKNNVYEVK
jgi:hypothetical protein